MDTITDNTSGMTPKQKYEARKAARKARDGSTAAERELEIMDILDRFTTAVERIADALETKYERGDGS